MPARDVRHPELAKNEFARGLAPAVITRDAQAIQFQGQGESPQQIRHQDHTAVEDRDNGQLAVAIIIRDLRGQLVEPAMDRRLVEENALQVCFHW